MEYNTKNQKNDNAANADVLGADTHPTGPGATIVPAIFNIAAYSARRPFHAFTLAIQFPQCIRCRNIAHDSNYGSHLAVKLTRTPPQLVQWRAGHYFDHGDELDAENVEFGMPFPQVGNRLM
jgi:hypothetical protein